MRIFFLFLFFFICNLSFSQEVTVFGIVTDADTGKPIDYATVYEHNAQVATETDAYGKYRLLIPAGKSAIIEVSRIGYMGASVKLPAMASGAKRYVNFDLVMEASDVEVIVRGSRIEDVGMVKEEVHEIKLLPTVSGNLESALPSIALGTSAGSGGELSSQYNVRGGNYDENQVYINDFQIFRPQLIRSGQQEGLSFPNIDMIRSLSFSSGGFESKYGDKLSSVLDIQYKRPEAFQGSIGAGLLGGSLHFEGSKRIGSNAYNKLRYLIGGRYKTTKLVLGSLDTKGEYLPSFLDLQTYLTYDITRNLQIGFLGNYNSNIYEFTPASRTTTIGSLFRAVSLNAFFDGGERDRFINGTTGVSLTYLPEREKNPIYLKMIGSYFSSDETEAFDITGAYRLSEIDIGLGSETYGEELFVLGTGVEQNYARNELYSAIANIEHRGGIEFQGRQEGKLFDSHFLQWGVKFQKERFEDDINEWTRLDSAGFTLPLNQDALTLDYVLKTANTIVVTKVSGFVQNSYNIRQEDRHELKVTLGSRFTYRDINDEFLVSPRAQILYKPLVSRHDISLKLSGGLYYQQPFYREMRRPDGTINYDLKSQRSIHIVGGVSYDFTLNGYGDTKFRFISEVYHKRLDNLVSYDLDNVRIRYSGENDATGYVSGIDMRVNGEFVKGAESWINLSFLSAREKLKNVQHLRFNADDPDSPIEVNTVPRPTDQWMTLSMFFQDYLPMNEKFRMHANLSFAGGLPYGFKDNNEVYRNNFRFRSYHRIDLGFGYQLWEASWLANNPNHPLRFAKSAWVSLEVFNLMKVANQASVTWIKDITNRNYAIPNNLTSRRFNLRLKMDF